MSNTKQRPGAYLVADGNAYALLNPANPEASWLNLAHAPLLTDGVDWENLSAIDHLGLDAALAQLCITVAQALHTAIDAHAKYAELTSEQLDTTTSDPR